MHFCANNQRFPPVQGSAVDRSVRKKCWCWPIGPGLALADLRHEWVLSLCMILAVAAVLGPLLVLFGLKYGTMEIMRQRLLQDPRNREIRPLASRSFDRNWFLEMQDRPEVAFVVPTTRQISAAVEVSLKDGKTISLDLLPTASGDPLILENGSATPGQGQCVLSEDAAVKLGARSGDRVTVSAKRLVGTRAESGSLELAVIGILDPRAGTLPALYAPLSVLEAVEAFKDGLAVPVYGWPGQPAQAYPVYDGAVVILPGELGPVDHIKLTSGTGFSKVEPLSPQHVMDLGGDVLPKGWRAYLVSSMTRASGPESVDAIALRLRGRGAQVRPWVRSMKAEIDGRGRVFSIALAADISEADPDSKHLIRLPANSAPSGPAVLKVWREGRGLELPVTISDNPSPGILALCPARLAGKLNLLAQRPISWDPHEKTLRIERRGFAGFRLYASGLDQVEILKVLLEAQGLPVHTQTDRIRDVRELNRYLTLIYWLVASVGAAGGAAALAASLYASILRKRRDLSVLRLLGLSRPSLLAFPAWQSLGICCGGFLTAAAFFYALANLVNGLFREHLQTNEKLCALTGWHVAAALAGVCLIGLAASGLAAWRVMRIDPAEALRDE